MDIATVIEQVGVPLTLAVGGLVVLGRFIGAILRKLFEVQQARLDAVISERDHFRDRMETADDRTRDLAREMVAALREQRVHRPPRKWRRKPPAAAETS